MKLECLGPRIYVSRNGYAYDVRTEDDDIAYVPADIADGMLAAAKMLRDAANCKDPQAQIDWETRAWVALDAAIAKAEGKSK